MVRLSSFLIHLPILLICLPAAFGGDETPVPDPALVSGVLREQLPAAKEVTVGLCGATDATGVLISAAGDILTAGHVLQMLGKKPVKVRLSDGREFEAEPLGYNIESDIGLLRITGAGGGGFPFCMPAGKAPSVGSFCFLLGHPSGLVEGRPTQVRLGRVQTVLGQEDRPFVIYSDANIQPGDSGGPLFSLDGNLIGIASSAVSIRDCNVFACIGQFTRASDKFEGGEVWGDAENPPMAPTRFSVDPTRSLAGKLQAELQSRVRAGHRRTLDFVRAHRKPGGGVALGAQDLFDFMRMEAVVLERGGVLSLGLDDPLLEAQLPAEKPPHFLALQITDGDRPITRAVALDAEHLLCKAGEVAGAKPLQLRLKGGARAVEVAAVREELDLAILEVSPGGAAGVLPVIRFPKAPVPVAAGQVLYAPDAAGRPIWSIATDTRRPVTEKISPGPVVDPADISGVGVPFPAVIRHSLPLYARDAGTPVFDLDGNFVGIHLARLSRTLGAILPHEEIFEFYQEFRARKKRAPRDTGLR